VGWGGGGGGGGGGGWGVGSGWGGGFFVGCWGGLWGGSSTNEQEVTSVSSDVEKEGTKRRGAVGFRERPPSGVPVPPISPFRATHLGLARGGVGNSWLLATRKDLEKDLEKHQWGSAMRQEEKKIRPQSSSARREKVRIAAQT